MTQKDKKQKGKRETTIEHRSGKISKIIKLEYIAEITCWCGSILTIDSSKAITDNICQGCGSPYKLLNEEWTHDEQERIFKFIQSRGIK